MATLPKVLDTVKMSWEQYKANWNNVMRISIWMLWIAILEAIISALPLMKFSGSTGLSFLLFLIIVPLSIFISIRLMYAVLSITHQKEIESDNVLWKKAKAVFMPVCWLALLQIICLLGASVFLIIPAIYLSLGFSFSTIILLEQNLHGTSVLGAGLDLVRGRWWSTFWLLMAGLALIMIPTMIVSGTLFGTLTAIAGVNALVSSHPLVYSAQTLFQGAIQTVILPLVLLYEVNVYRALKK